MTLRSLCLFVPVFAIVPACVRVYIDSHVCVCVR